MDGGASDAEHWREIAAQKEKEWKDVTEQRIRTLEVACHEKEKLLKEEKAKFIKLKEDFKYNLRLLEERDQELNRYDTTFADIKAQLNVKNVEVSDCKIQMDDLKAQLACEANSREELQLHYQSRLREKTAEIDSYRTTKDGEIQEERTHYESFKRKLERQLTQVEEEMDAQRREITAEFEEAMKKREYEFRLQADESSAKLLEYELKAKLLGKELDLVKVAQQKNSEEFNHVETNHRALEKNLKEKDWELQDMKAMKDAKISDLENQIHQNNLSMKRHQEGFERKHSELDKYCREKEGALNVAKEAFGERESELQNTIRELQSKHEDSQVELRKLQWASADLEKEKNSQIEKLQEQLARLKEKWDKQIVEVSRSQVGKDLEVQNLRETDEKLRLEIVQKKEDIDRYKKELSAAVEREASLERSKMQLELDWQRRYDDLERLQYEKSEDLVKKLTRARDEAQASVKEKARELQHKQKLITILQTEREQAMLTLKHNGIKLDTNIQVDLEKSGLVSADEMKMLQSQNDNLKLVIKQMRGQMEQLGHDLPADVNIHHSPRDTSTVSEDYVKDLEKECRNLRQKNREMEQDTDVARRFGRPPAPQLTNQSEVLTQVKDNMLVKNHIQSLNDLIGSLRAEKVELSAQVKKQQAHVLHQDRTLEKHNKQQREKQVELDQLQYDLGAVTRRTNTEMAGLREKVNELELQLLEARKEADEYYRSNLERNMEVTALGQEVSSLKLQLAEKRPGINYGGQELVIQQLQDQILNLKQQGAEFSAGSESGDGSQQDGSAGAGKQIQALRVKLKSAVKKISELARERQQLIEMGNKLRSELNKAGIDIPTVASGRGRMSRPVHQPTRDENYDHMTSHPVHQPIRDKNYDHMMSHAVHQPIRDENYDHMTSEKVSSKLNQLEKLQYQLTRQELQYAQKYHGGGRGDTMGENGSSDPDEYRPPSILKKPGNVRESMDGEFDVRASVNTEGGETIHSIPTARSQSQLQMSMSSMGGESLQEIWKMLDDGRPSPTPRLSSSPQRTGVNVRQSVESTGSGNHNFYIAGRNTGQDKNMKPQKNLSDKAAGKVFKKIQNKPAVRNYNMKDDRSVR